MFWIRIYLLRIWIQPKYLCGSGYSQNLSAPELWGFTSEPGGHDMDPVKLTLESHPGKDEFFFNCNSFYPLFMVEPQSCLSGSSEAHSAAD